uniref:Uncharacterized protein n=1 Tax=Cacopsylla melanoneura TaxID=428564 RepID=A0A8D9EDL8_9HEMI
MFQIPLIMFQLPSTMYQLLLITFDLMLMTFLVTMCFQLKGPELEVRSKFGSWEINQPSDRLIVIRGGCRGSTIIAMVTCLTEFVISLLRGVFPVIVIFV